MGLRSARRAADLDTTIARATEPLADAYLAALAEFERHVMAADAPAVVLIDRALVRALLRYVRRLERQFDLLPPGHPAIAMPEMIAKAVADAVAKAEDAVTFSTTHASRSDLHQLALADMPSDRFADGIRVSV